MLKIKSNYAHELFKAYSSQFLIDVYKKGPKRLQLAIEGLNEKDLLTFIIPDKWNILEIVIHTTHSEISGALRIRQTITQSSTLFSFYDQDIWTKQLIRNAGLRISDMHDHLSVFTLLRKITAPLFENATREEWNRYGLHPELGPMNLRHLLDLYADHSERHISQILERRKLLGKQILVEPLLNERLY